VMGAGFRLQLSPLGSGLRGGCAAGVFEPPCFAPSPFLAYIGRISQPNKPLFPPACAERSPHLTGVSRLTRAPGAKSVLIACFPLQILTIGHTRTGNCHCTNHTVNPACMVPGHSDLILCIAFSPDGKRVVSGSEDKTVKIWDARTGAQVSSHPPPPSRLRPPFPAPFRFGVRGQFCSEAREKTPAFSFHFSIRKPADIAALSCLIL